MNLTQSQILALALSWRTGAEELKMRFRGTPNAKAAALQAEAIEQCAARLEAIAHKVEGGAS